MSGSHSEAWNSVRTGPLYELLLAPRSESAVHTIVARIKTRPDIELTKTCPLSVGEVDGSATIEGKLEVPIGLLFGPGGTLALALPADQLEARMSTTDLTWGDVDKWLTHVAADLTQEDLIKCAGIGAEDSLAEVDDLEQMVPARSGEPAIIYIDGEGTVSKRRLPWWS